jgi:uncharacterized protein
MIPNRGLATLSLLTAFAAGAFAMDQTYDGAKRISEYLTMADGTRVAYDLFLPMTKGAVEKKPMPVLFKYTPYGRAWTIFDKKGRNNLAALVDLPWYGDAALRFRSLLVGDVKHALERTTWLEGMVRSGYAVVVADRPGTGASFGKLAYSPDLVGREASEIIDWIAARSWCDGNVGMFGDSIQAQIQFQAAATGNPHLKAILPATTWMDNYSAVMFPGGVLDSAFVKIYEKANLAFDGLATPVDSDPKGILLAEARAERGDISLVKVVRAVGDERYRDSPLPDGRKVYPELQSLYPLLDRINRAGVPAYLIGGWYDIYARDDFLIYQNLTVPKRLLVRPTDHSGIEEAGKDIDYAKEAHRWFDYWLKKIDNGIMDEAPIRYNLQGTGKPNSLRTTQAWPPENSKLATFFLGTGGVAGTRAKDGRLTLSAPDIGGTSDSYTVDYSTTTGTKPHWSAVAMPHNYPDMRNHDAKSLTYTTAPFDSDQEIVGHPVLRLWLESTAADLDLFAYLEAVDTDGRSTYVTQGNLRASHRKPGQAPFDNLGLPWHDHFESGLEAIPRGRPIELAFDLLPTAYRFAKGQRLRIAIACADRGNFETPVVSPAPTLRLLMDSEHPSSVQLPFIRRP